MRRPFFKLKEFSKDAMLIMKLFDTIFHEDKKIKEKFSDPEDIRRERCACLGPLFNDLKNYLDRLGRNLKKEDEPELLKAVNDLGFVSTERRYEAPMCCTPGASK